MADSVDFDVTPTAFQTTYTDHFVTNKDNYDAAGNPVGALATTLIVQSPTAEYARVLDGCILNTQKGLAVYASKSALEALGTDDGFAVGDVVRTADGVYYVCQTAAASTSTWSPALGENKSTYIEFADPDQIRVGDSASASTTIANSYVGWIKSGVTRNDIAVTGSSNVEWRQRNSSGAITFTTYYQNADGSWSFPGWINMPSASPRHTIGNGSGNPSLYMNGVAENLMVFQSAGTVRWRMKHNASSNELAAQRYDASGVYQEDSWKLDVNGNFIVAKTAAIGGSVSSTRVLNITTASGVERVGLIGSSNNYLEMDSPTNRRNEIEFRTAGTLNSVMGRGDSDDLGSSIVWYLGTTSQDTSAAIMMNSTRDLTLGATSSNKVGMYGATPVAQQTVTGSRAAGAALTDLLTKLANVGIIVDGTSA